MRQPGRRTVRSTEIEREPRAPSTAVARAVPAACASGCASWFWPCHDPSLVRQQDRRFTTFPVVVAPATGTRCLWRTGSLRGNETLVHSDASMDGAIVVVEVRYLRVQFSKQARSALRACLRAHRTRDVSTRQATENKKIRKKRRLVPCDRTLDSSGCLALRVSRSLGIHGSKHACAVYSTIREWNIASACERGGPRVGRTCCCARKR